MGGYEYATYSAGIMIFSIDRDFSTFLSERTHSTMDLAKAVAKHIPEGSGADKIFCVCAREQTAGRGRGGTRWIQGAGTDQELNPEPSLAPASVTTLELENLKIISQFTESHQAETDVLPLTLCLPSDRIRIPMEWLTAAVGCAVLDALAETSSFVQTTFPELPIRKRGEEARLCLKWPNDIVAYDEAESFAKMCGILCETTVSGASFQNVYVGIGLNFFEAPKDIPGALCFWDWLVDTEPAIAIERRRLNKWRRESAHKRVILSRFLMHLGRELEEYLCVPRSVGQLRGLALSRALPIGTLLSVNKGTRSGQFQGFSEDGGLILAGDSEPIYSGDVTPIKSCKAPELPKPSSKDTVAPATRAAAAISHTNGLAKSLRASGLLNARAKPLGRKATPALDDSTAESTSTVAVSKAEISVALDLGNTRIHWGFCQDSRFVGPFHMPYETVIEDNTKAMQLALKPVLELLVATKPKGLSIRCCSVNEKSLTRKVQISVEKFLAKMFPEMRVSFAEFTAKDILSHSVLKSPYAETELGSDRALKFHFAAVQAEIKKQTVAVFSFGTALTCEAVNAQGEIVESLISSGLQMGLASLHKETARLPALTLSAEELGRDSDLDEPIVGAATADRPETWNTTKALQRGAFYAGVGTMAVVLKRHGITSCVVTGGNAEAILPVFDSLRTALGFEDVELEYIDGLEPRTLLALESPGVGAPQHFGAARLVADSLTRSRIFKREDVAAHPIVREDFRKIGGRIENIGLGDRIDAYLAHQFPFHNRELWRARIEAGEVLVQHDSPRMPVATPGVLASVKPTYKVKAFDQLWLHHPQAIEPDSVATCEVVFDDGDVVAFCKPGNLVMHAAGLYVRNTFVKMLEKMLYKDTHPVHRIDRETSGLVVCARTPATRHLISRAFVQGEMKKMYFAVCKGQTQVPEYFRIDAPIGDAVDSKIRLKLGVNGPNGSEALTHVAKLAAFEDYSLFACLPQTGRTNQIRIHLASIGQWIVGDKMYHPDERVFLEFYEKGATDWVNQQLHFPRHLLHNTAIRGPASLGSHLGNETIVCPLTEDILSYEPLQKLLGLAGISREHDAQMLAFKELFTRLQEVDFSTVETLGSPA